MTSLSEFGFLCSDNDESAAAVMFCITSDCLMKASSFMLFKKSLQCVWFNFIFKLVGVWCLYPSSFSKLVSLGVTKKTIMSRDPLKVVMAVG